MNWLDDLNATTSPTALIAASDAKRDIGFDTINNALGKLPGTEPKTKYRIKLCPNDARQVAEALDAIAVRCAGGQPELVAHHTLSLRIAYEIDTKKVRGPAVGGSNERNADAFLHHGDLLKYMILVKHRHGRHSEMIVTINRDGNGSYWLSILANPTSLILGYNAFAVAMRGKSHRTERRIMMRVPFGVLRRIVRSQSKNFDWHADTKDRIKTLSFRNCPSQVFTYVNPAPKTPHQWLGFLRAVFSVSYSDGHIHRLLCDDLGFEMMTKVTPDGVETLTFLFRKDKRLAWSVNLYDKHAKAKADAESIKLEIGDEKVQRFLSRTVRVDVTIHDEGQRQMQREAKIIEQLEAANVTAANYTRAIEIMDNGEGISGKRFSQWLLDLIFGQLMRLWLLLEYKPSKLKSARDLLKNYNSDVFRGLNEWVEKGFEHFSESSGTKRSVSFEQFLAEHAKARVTRPIARAARQKLLSLGLDPDVPLRAYDAFYNQTFVWDLSDEDRHRLAKAHEAGDYNAVRVFQGRSRESTETVIAEIKATFTKMVRSAHTPATTLGAPEA